MRTSNYFLSILIVLLASESYAQRLILVKQRPGDKTIDSLSYGDFVQCIIGGQIYKDGYIKEIGDSSIVFKATAQKPNLVPYDQIVAIRKIPGSRIRGIPFFGLGISGLGLLGSLTGVMDQDLAKTMAATGLLVVSINGLDRSIRYKPKKLLAKYRIGDLIYLDIAPDLQPKKKKKRIRN